MSEKKALSREIKMLEEEIKALESKRARSQASLIESLISREKPSDEETQYFRTYTAEIELKRERLLELVRKREQLD